MTNLVHIGPLTFDGDGNSPWVFTRLKGWLSGAPMRNAVEENPVGDGAFEVERDFRGPRILTFTGALRGDDPEQAHTELFDAFAALQSDGRPIVLAVEKDWGIRWCTVSLMNATEIDELFTDSHAPIQAQFIARDPVKYGESRTVSTALPSSGGGLEYPLHDPAGALFYGAVGDLGRVTLTNAGTAEVWPTLRVTGGLESGFFAQRLDTGQVVRYDRVVPDGTDVSVDFRTGEVLIDGVSDGSTYLTSYDFFSVGPGESVEVQFNAIGAATGSPEMFMTISDGYW